MHMWNKLSPRQMLHRFSRGLVQASAVIGYFEVSSQMKICAVLIQTNVWHGISWISKMWLCRSMMVTMPARCPSLRQFRLKRAVESIECENTTAAWVKTMTELVVIQDLEPPSKWNSSDSVKNRREMKTNEVIVLIVFHTDSLYVYVKQAESATDAPQVQPRARASERSDWIFWSVFTNENLRVLIKTNVWHGISWISKMWLCRSMMVTCLHGARPLRQFRLKRAVESIECENTTAAWVKTMTELVIQDLEPPSKWNSSDAVKNRSEMKTNEVIVW